MFAHLSELTRCQMFALSLFKTHQQAWANKRHIFSDDICRLFLLEFKELKSANLLNFFYNILFACYDVTWFSFEDLHAHYFILKKNLAKLKSGFIYTWPIKK